MAETSSRIKLERSPTPPPVAPRLIVQGSEHWPLPENCVKTVSEYRTNRKVWTDGVKHDLRRRGIHTVKAFIRDDGLAVDWRSDTPIWSDSVKNASSMVRPPPSTPAERKEYVDAPAKKKQRLEKPIRPAQVMVAEVIDVDALDSSSSSPNSRKPATNSLAWNSSNMNSSSTNHPGHPGPVAPSNVSEQPVAFTTAAAARPKILRTNPAITSLETPRPSDPTSSTVTHLSRKIPQALSVNRVTKNGISFPIMPGAEKSLASVIEEPSGNVGQTVRVMEIEAINYIERYLHTFDTDRAALASAYAHDALFSYRIHDVATLPMSIRNGTLSPAEAFAPRKGSRDLAVRRGPVYQGRVDIITAVLSLGDCLMCPAHIRYDVLSVNMTRSSIPPHISTPRPAPAPAPVPTTETAFREYHRLFISCTSRLLNEGNDGHVEIDQTFLLRRRGDNSEDRDTPGLWNLVAVSHQLAVRDIKSS